jgi:hypothetical protein
MWRNAMVFWQEMALDWKYIRDYKFKVWYVQNLGVNDENPPNGDLIQHVCSFNGKL